MAEDRPVSRDMLRAEIGKIWNWPQISSVLQELEEKEYIETLSTRGGGIFRPGEKYQQWVEEMEPIESRQEVGPPAENSPVNLSGTEAEALVALIREVAVSGASPELLEKVRGWVDGFPTQETLNRLGL